jgi:osmotically-inducible protein OsmY
LFSFHEKQIAQEVVAGVIGVTQVVNEIQVE